MVVLFLLSDLITLNLWWQRTLCQHLALLPTLFPPRNPLRPFLFPHILYDLGDVIIRLHLVRSLLVDHLQQKVQYSVVTSKGARHLRMVFLPLGGVRENLKIVRGLGTRHN